MYALLVISRQLYEFSYLDSLRGDYLIAITIIMSLRKSIKLDLCFKHHLHRFISMIIAKPIALLNR